MQSFEINKADLERIKAALESDDAELEKVLQEYHASEIAILFEKLPVEAREKIISGEFYNWKKTMVNRLGQRL